MSQPTEKLDLWCIVELFGHSQIAGKCTEQNIAGTNMLRVDVPEIKSQGAFTKFYGSGAIYAINPVEKDVALAKAEMLDIKPIESWSLKEMQKKTLALAVKQGHLSFEDGLDSDDDDDLPY